MFLSAYEFNDMFIAVLLHLHHNFPADYWTCCVDYERMLNRK